MIRLCFLAAAAWVQAETAPIAVRQGHAIHIRAEMPAVSARMNGKTIPLFPQPEGGRLGLMPVPATTRPGKYPLEYLDSDNTVVRTAAVVVRDARFPKQNIVLDKTTRELRASPDEIETVRGLAASITGARHWREPFVAPVSGCVTSPFGVQRLYDGRPSGNYHSGIDQRSPAGRPVRATADGTVRLVRDFDLHGRTVGIDHGQGVVSVYLHLSRFAVDEGAGVKKGGVIGYVGSTGRSTAPHLHWTLYVNGVPVNPSQWVRLTSCAKRAPKRSR